MKQLLPVLLTSLALSHAGSALAITIDGGPAWPGSADVTGSFGSGNVANGGNTYTYPNIGASPVEHLYFGLYNTTGQGFSGDGPGISGAELFTWFGDTATSIEYRGQINVPTTSGSNTYLTRLMLTALSGGSVVSDATTQGLVGGVHSLIEVTGSSFSILREVEILNGGIWQDALNFYNAIPNKTNSSTDLSFSTGFYWDDLPPVSQVPEPGIFGLIGLGLLGLALARRSKA